MSALYDFVAGDSPQIDPEVCKRKRIGVDRVWRVAAFMLEHARNVNDNILWMGRGYLSKELGIHERTIRAAVEVLEESGVLRRVGEAVYPLGSKNYSVQYRPAWTVSKTPLKFRLESVRIDQEEAKRQRLGQDRAFRIAVLMKVKGSTEAVARAIGAALRTVRYALKAITGVIFRDPRQDKDSNNSLAQVYPPTGDTPEHARERARIEPTSDPGQVPTDNFFTKLKRKFGGRLMPYEIFSDGVTMDEGCLPTRQVVRSEWANDRVKHAAKGQPRRNRPLETWTPMDSALEFRDRFLLTYPTAPGSTGSMVQLAKILGKLRKDYGHDARVEMMILDSWLSDAIDVAGRNTHVAPWRKWLASFATYYAAAENRAKYVEPEYQTVADRFYAEHPERLPSAQSTRPSAEDEAAKAALLQARLDEMLAKDAAGVSP